MATGAGDRPLRVYGHRGAPRECAENTVRSFERALVRGANALEMDVHLTKDGLVVVHHDESGERAAGERRLIAECTYREVRSWNVARTLGGDADQMPLLADVLDRFGGVPMSVDLKDARPCLARAVVAELAERPQRVTAHVSLTSFHAEPFRALHALGYTGPLGMGPLDVLRLWSLPTVLLSDLRGRAVQVPTHHRRVRLDTRRFVDKAHALGCRVDYWVINDPEEAARLRALGADGLVTDDARAFQEDSPG